MWEESWAQPAIQWLLTPALITGGLFALAQLYDPPTRWSRRLKSDIAIMGGLPEGPERRVWQEWIEWQAMRLREYRLAFVGWTHFWKWAGLLALGLILFGVIAYPPLNKPGEPVMWGPADYGIMLGGFLSIFIYLAALGSGADFLGRTPRQIIIRRRVRAYDRRMRKLRRIDKERARRIAEGAKIRARGSRLGFSTQVDELGAWVRDPDLRLAAKVAGFVGADIAGRAFARARERGVEIPPWPELEPSSAPATRTAGGSIKRSPRLRAAASTRQPRKRPPRP
ncbi:hypothetical protein F6B41_12310 [Microbacterium lushaniae]|nr:hypothetical protein F6B41_12310 [Microbacterium lushaniae]